MRSAGGYRSVSTPGHRRLALGLLTCCFAAPVAEAFSGIPKVRFGAPPIGARYERELRLPVIGLQKLSLHILTKSAARITLIGALNLDEPIKYSIDSAGNLLFQLSERTIRLLRRLGVSLRAAEYTPDGDSAAVTISPPMIPPIRIALARI